MKSGKIELSGEYGTATVFTGAVESAVEEQLKTLLNHPIAKNGHVRIMPDCHAGAGCVIGYTARLSDKVVPNLIGVDIGCGVCAWKLPETEKIDFAELDRFIRQSVPSGHQVRDSVHPGIEEAGAPPGAASFGEFTQQLDAAVKRTGQESERVRRSLGSLGGGNHFIEIDIDEAGTYWLIVHSGSRNFGLQIARRHQETALEKCGKMNGLEYLEGRDKNAYLRDMALAQEYAARNRRIIGCEIIGSFFGYPYRQAPLIESVHNYISFDDHIVRKGAISAAPGEELIIPLNMAEGCLIGRGKGNREWNNSAPHGAGRKMSRRQAKKQIPLSDFREIMNRHHVWTNSVGKQTLDESPQAYKNTKQLKEDLAPSVEITSVLKSVYNFKAPS